MLGRVFALDFASAQLAAVSCALAWGVLMDLSGVRPVVLLAACLALVAVRRLDALPRPHGSAGAGSTLGSRPHERSQGPRTRTACCTSCARRSRRSSATARCWPRRPRTRAGRNRSRRCARSPRPAAACRGCWRRRSARPATQAGTRSRRGADGSRAEPAAREQTRRLGADPGRRRQRAEPRHALPAAALARLRRDGRRGRGARPGARRERQLRPRAPRHHDAGALGHRRAAACVREKRSREELPVIMATARDQADDVIEALRLGRQRLRHEAPRLPRRGGARGAADPASARAPPRSAGWPPASRSGTASSARPSAATSATRSSRACSTAAERPRPGRRDARRSRS